tara:strand:+ start:26452 stop:29163 length:2712 start_codon:yes stop_codon:yes gene_type:complete
MIGFLSPMLLLGLLSLPILYWLLRATPPAPIIRAFPAVGLLLGLKSDENTPDRTPWWLLLLRLIAVAAVIIGFAGPILNPTERVKGTGPLLIVMDASWASAQSWEARRAKVIEILRQAVQDNRPVALQKLSDAPRGEIAFQSGNALLSDAQVITPNAWKPDYLSWADAIKDTDVGQVVWLSDGLNDPNRDAFLTALGDADLTVVDGLNEPIAVRPVTFEQGALNGTIVRPIGSVDRDLTLELMGTDLNGVVRPLMVQQMTVQGREQSVTFEMPTELRNRVRYLRVRDVRSAGAVALTDDSVQSRKIALMSGSQNQEAGTLLSNLHYLRNALINKATLIETDIDTALVANPDIMIFADVGRLSDIEEIQTLEWVAAGGTLVRFAGPRLISSGIGQREEDPLLPVRLRSGGRDVGGAMSWGEPKKLRDFTPGSPFFGLDIPSDVSVSSQVIAQPDPNLSERVLASLADGTPLVTAKEQGAGRVILFHVTANAEWSNLPLSGLFVQMLDRLSISTARQSVAGELDGLTWTPLQVMDGFGNISDAQDLGGVEGADFAKGVSRDRPAGVYGYQDRRVAHNVISSDTTLIPAVWPTTTTRAQLTAGAEVDLKPFFISAAIAILIADILATLGVSGLLFARASVLIVAVTFAGQTKAQDDTVAITAANNTVLAYVITGDARVDRASKAGLVGLSAELTRRTAIEPIAPVGVNLDSDELSLLPFLYWPMSDGQNAPSDVAITKINRFIRTGGMILFDTRDANVSGTIGGGTKNGRKLQEIAARLDIPQLEPIPQDHVLTRSFYLLQDFPGRYMGPPVWVEITPKEELQEGMPFRNSNDGVTPVLIGGNDWASAWAIDDNGRFMFPVGRGRQGELQREYAQRFGVNLIMYVMTGNYKSDQVHVPSLLERLGQ